MTRLSEQTATVVLDLVDRTGNAPTTAELNKALLDRIAELEAIVDKLPKMADGVPLVPGMRAYGSFRDGVEAGTVYPWTSRSRVMFIPQNYSSDDPHLIHSPAGTFMMAATSAIYSTREAAEAAKD